MSTHAAVVTTAVKAPLEIHQVPTVAPEGDEVLLHVEWTGSTPLDLHVADGGLLADHPAVLGSSYAGTVVKLGPSVTRLRLQDKVFGFGFGAQKQKAHQELATVPEYLLGRIPQGFTPQAAVTLPSNFVTIFNTAIRNFGMDLPWPKPEGFVPEHADDPIFVWGASSSVGQFALQIFKYYGFKHLFAAASKKQHDLVKSLGATAVFDYRNANVTEDIVRTAKQAKSSSPSIPFVIDCIGSVEGTMKPINNFVEAGAQVAVMLPVIVRHSSEDVVPKYSMDVPGSIAWREGVLATGVRTHDYLDNSSLKENVQPVVMPAMLAQRLVQPNKQRVIEGATLLDRATKALDILRSGDYSGEKLVWRVNETEA